MVSTFLDKKLIHQSCLVRSSQDFSGVMPKPEIRLVFTLEVPLNFRGANHVACYLLVSKDFNHGWILLLRSKL